MQTYTAMKSIYGEEYKGDTRFVARCRKLQSIYRVEIGEEIRPYKGRDGQVHYYGNYIDCGDTASNGCWKNFLTGYAFDYAKERCGNRQERETIEADRLFNNLLSSQPMAFNLFCPLKQLLEEFPQEATRAIKAALPMFPIDKVTEVGLEFIPENYKQLTGDKSAMDAIIRFENRDGKECFIAVETKYSENLGSNEASRKEKSINAIKSLNCFIPEVEKRLYSGDIRLTQIYRNFLLSETYGAWKGAESFSIILAPKEHPSTDREIESLHNELRPEYKDKIKKVNLEDFVKRIICVCPQEYATVFERFYDRYLNFKKLKNID